MMVTLQVVLSGVMLIEQVDSECPQAGIAINHFANMDVKERFQIPVWLPLRFILHRTDSFVLTKISRCEEASVGEGVTQLLTGLLKDLVMVGLIRVKD